MNLTWTNEYPSREILRKDIDAMVKSTVHTIFKYFPKKHIYGIYYKGSSSKQWDSIIDYVPGVSDVDIHVQFTNDRTYNQIISNPKIAMMFSEDIEKKFRKINPKFYHMPELQLNSLNKLYELKEYRSTPSKVIKLLYGKPYPVHQMSKGKTIRISVKQVIDERKYINKLPNRLLDKNAVSMKKFLKDIGWHISPSSMNFLVAKGIPYSEAFSMNRTNVSSALKKLGYKDAAENFEGFYYHAWRYYLNNQYPEIKNAILHADRFLREILE